MANKESALLTKADLRGLEIEVKGISQRVDKLEHRYDKKFDDILRILDAQTVILQRLDQERIFTLEWIRRIESDVALLKKHVGLVS